VLAESWQAAWPPAGWVLVEFELSSSWHFGWIAGDVEWKYLSRATKGLNFLKNFAGSRRDATAGFRGKAVNLGYLVRNSVPHFCDNAPVNGLRKNRCAFHSFRHEGSLTRFGPVPIGEIVCDI